VLNHRIFYFEFANFGNTPRPIFQYNTIFVNFQKKAQCSHLTLELYDEGGLTATIVSPSKYFAFEMFFCFLLQEIYVSDNESINM
jgi:hypothetical protein